MLGLVRACCMLLCFAESILSIFLPRSVVLRHQEGPRGGMLEQQKAEGGSQRASLPAYLEGSTCLLLVGMATALPRQSIHGEENPPLCSAHHFRTGTIKEKWLPDAWERGSAFQHFAIEIHPCTLGLMGEMQHRVWGEKKTPNHQERESFLDGYLSPIQKHHGGIYTHLFHNINCPWVAHIRAFTFTENINKIILGQLGLRKQLIKAWYLASFENDCAMPNLF